MPSYPAPHTPSPSALRMALMRAAHQLLDEPRVLHDPYALRILGDQALDLIADPYALNDPMTRPLRAAIVGRSRWAEDELDQAARQGVQHLVLLGTGLDTYSLRAPSTVQVLEIDHPAVQDWKRRRLHAAQLRLPEHVRLLPCDLARQGLDTCLAQAGVPPDEPLCVVALGLMPYLRAERVQHLLACAGRYPAGTRILFDFRVNPAALPPMERMLDGMMAQQCAAGGEPWLSAFQPHDVDELLNRLGFSRRTLWDTETLNRHYFPQRRDGLQSIGAGLRLMRAVV